MIALVGNVSTIADQRITQIQEYQKTTQNHWTVLARVWNLETERKDLRDSQKTEMKIALKVMVNFLLDFDVVDRDVQDADVRISR